MSAHETEARKGAALGAWLRGAWDVVVLEAKQRLRSRGWYIMLAVWFVVIGLVTWLTWASWNAQRELNRAISSPDGVVTDLPPESAGPGSMIFEVVLAFVLFLALIVAPALSANAVNGDRAQGTLAVVQATLLSPGQILAGKLAAAWLAALAFLAAAAPFLVIGVALGGMSPATIAVSLLMLAVELAVVCSIGVGVSALAGRPLFSIVVTYLIVALLVVGTLIAFGFGAALARGTIRANNPSYLENIPTRPQAQIVDPGYTCSGPLTQREVVRTERVAWFLAMNPYVVVADAIPYPDRSRDTSPYPQGAIESVSQGARAALAGPDATYPCVNGQPKPSYFVQTTPLWPLGLGLQLVLAGGLFAAARSRLVTPARRLSKGTRVA
ncbi:ABC transporter permease [Sinomonas mesophila]|uniref:ABC transporter permease n=1 Tax=Sinomonas mesophila TaxID=1531955 RepID=UPI000984422E|nr:ABC transporter permease subunit [Sinomonas mesophila]